MSASAESLAAYQAAFNAIESGKAAVDSVFKKAGDVSPTLCEINQRASQVQNMTVVRNKGGDVIGYDYKYTTPQSPDTSMMEINSNSDSGMYAIGGGGQSGGGGAGRYNGSQYAGSVVSDSQSTDKMEGSGLVSGNVSSAWALASVLAKMGKTVADETLESLNGAASDFNINFDAMCTDSDTANALRALFGTDSQGNTTMYLDEDVIGALAITARDNSFFEDGGLSPGSETITYDNPDKGVLISTVDFNALVAASPITDVNFESGGIVRCKAYEAGTTGYIFNFSQAEYMVAFADVDRTIGTYGDTYTVIALSRQTFLWGRKWGSLETPPEPNSQPSGSVVWPSTGETWYYAVSGTSNEGNYPSLLPNQVINFTRRESVVWLAIELLTHGGVMPITPIPGESTQPGATVPVDAITGADPHVVAGNLVNEYPQIMGSPVQIVTMDDSCNVVTKNYYSVPISYSPTNLNISAPITGGLQVSPSFNPEVTLDLPDIDMDNYIDQVIKIIGGSGAGRDVTTEPTPDTNPDIQPDTPSIDIPESGTSVVVPDTGSGTAPTPTTPTMLPTELWHVYRCTKTILDLFGQWLWGPAFDIELFKRLFSNPMDAVFGVHAIYAVPHVSGDDNIVCGNIASNVEASVIDEQYTTVTCGSVWLTEYFGNVFDYEPYTSVSIYLPFIGIVPLSVADVMRSNITVTYKVDVFTGACVAQISVLRDGVGGVIYEFSGNCSVGLPISGASYNNILSSMLSLTSGLSIAALSAGAGTPIGVAHGLSTAASSLTSARETVTRSGSFSGNIGAMGLKKPYLIISRPITEMATNFELFDGLPANKQVRLSECSGYTKCKEVHFSAIGAYKSEQDEIENLLRSGVIL